METIRVHDLTIRYAEAGDGTPVVVSHCSSGSHREWSALSREPADRFRVVTPDPIGYGGSDRRPAGRPYPPGAGVDVIVALAGRFDGPIHLAGHPYGAAHASSPPSRPRASRTPGLGHDYHAGDALVSTMATLPRRRGPSRPR